MTEAQKRLKVARAQFLAVAGAAAAFGAALTSAAIKGARDIDKLATTAKSLDATVASMQALQIAASEVGLEGLDGALVRLNRRLGAAEFGGGAAAVTVKALNLDLKALSEMDADERVAHLADALKDSGMSMQQVARHAQNLGFEQAQAAEFFAQGGDAIRAARARLDEYGLSVSQIDAKKVSDAAGQLGDLGLISQYVTQRLAVELVPALGAMAQAMTDSLKEGGLLRTMLDGLIDNLDRLGTYLAVIVTGFGVRYVGALVAARLATLNLAGALVALRGALIRTGIGLLVVGAGELVYWLGRVVAAAGGVSEALGRVGKVGLAVLIGVGDTAQGLVSIMAGVASSIAGSFLAAFALIGSAWDGLLNGLGSAFEAVTGKSLGTSNVGGAVGGLADGLLAQGGEQISSGFESIVSAGRDVAAAVSESMQSVGDDLGDGASAADRLAESLDGVADSAGGGGGKAGKGGAAPKIKEIKPALDEVSRGFDTFKSSVASAFEGLITGAHSFKDALAGVLSSLANVFAQSAVSGLMGSLKLPKHATGTPYAPGGLSLVGERGPELVNLPRGSQVLNANQTRGAMGGGGGVVRIVIEENEMFASRVRTEATGVAVEVTRKGISDNNRAQSDTRYLRGQS